LISAGMELYNSAMGALPATKLSVEEYLALDRKAEVHSEYIDGELFPLVAASMAHSTIILNVLSFLKERLAKTSCRPFPLARVRASPTKFLIPDGVAVCGELALTDEYQDTLTNPKVILEVLSPSTADYDYGEKFILYRKLESFEEYLLVAQDKARVEVARKTNDNRWVISTYEGLDAAVRIESLSVSLPMTDIYDGVDFEPAS
jgi:Uma2 family endonuclease